MKDTDRRWQLEEIMKCKERKFEMRGPERDL